VKENQKSPYLTEKDPYSVAKIGHWYLDFESMTSTLDDVTCNILEIPENSRLSLDKTDIFYVNESDKDTINDELSRIIEDGGSFCEIVPLKTPKNNYIWVILAASAVFEDDRCLQVKGLTLDITHQKKLERDLLQKNQLFNVAQRKAQLGHWLWDRKTNLATCSDNMCELLGIKKGSKVTLDTLLKDVHPEDMVDVQASLAITMQTKSYRSFTHRVIIDDEIRFIKVIGEVNTDSEGRVVNVLGISQDVTEQKKFENEILRKNHLLNVAEQKANMGHWFWQNGTNYILGSWNLFRLFGIEFEDEKAPIQTLLQFVHPKDAERVEKYRIRALKEKKLDQLIFRIILGNNDVRTLMVTGEVYEDDSNEIKEILGIFQDITEQKNFENQIIKNNDLLSLAEREAQMGHWHLKPGDKYATWSKNLLAMYGMKPEDGKVTFEEMLSYVHPDDRGILNDHKKKIESNGTYGDFIHRIILADGTVKTIKINETVYKNEQGEVEEIVGVCQDITKQYKEEARIRNIIDSAPYPNFILNQDSTIEMVNNEAQRLFGYSSQELIGNSIKMLIPTRFHDKGKMIRQAFFNTPKVQHIDIGEDLFMTSKKGKEIPVKVTVGPINNEDSILCSWIARDVTKEKQAEEKILASNEKLEALASELKSQNNQLEDFSHITTHNLRSPVNNLNGLLSVYKMVKTDDEKKMLFEKFEKVTEHLTQTLDTLVDTLKVQTGEPVKREKLKLSETLRKIKEILTAEIEDSQAEIIMDFSAVDTIVYNQIYLDSLFQNMISNAIKYRSPDRKPKIMVSSKLVGDKIKLSFKDNGLGIDMDKYGKQLFRMNKVFHNHPQAKGVGLFMTKSQIEALGGTIKAKSQVDRGTTFDVYLKKLKVFDNEN
tara:strand:+ start:1019 stop:3664 length:2646 start_codon:yes stop_codon:yes gene_type:complete